MASIEFLKERIQKAEETIAKKQNTITKKQVQIQKKESVLQKMGVTDLETAKWDKTNPNHHDIYWTICDIENLQDDIKRGSFEIAEKQESLAKYQAELATAEEKAGSRNVQVILDFLDRWKAQVTQFYQESLPRWISARNDYWAANKARCDWDNHNWRNPNQELIDAEKETKEIWKMFRFLDCYIDNIHAGTIILNMDRLQKDLNEEANAKYDFIIDRTNAIVGQITDASNLKIGSKGDLNGFIIGTKGVAKVQTIGAGGYNIQCFHFRTLINRMK